MPPYLFICLFIYSDRVLQPRLVGTFYVSEAGLKLVIFLPPPPECWDYKHVSPDPVVLTFSLSLSRAGYHNSPAPTEEE
jgi:hypothetical protein